MAMTDQELLRQLKRISVTGSQELRCLGCGYEHSCSLHGCAIIKAAAARLEALVSNPDTNAGAPPLLDAVPHDYSGLLTEVEP